MIKPYLILAIFLLIAFVPTKPGTLWRIGSTVGVIFTLHWMNTRIEQNETLIRKMYAHVTNKSEASVNEDFPPKSFPAACSQLVQDSKPYVGPAIEGLKSIVEEGINFISDKNSHTSMNPKEKISTDPTDKE